MDNYNEDEELHLDPRHTPVEKRNNVAHAFSTKPRFELSKEEMNANAGGGLEEDELLLSPQEHFYRKKLSGGVSMDRQT